MANITTVLTNYRDQLETSITDQIDAGGTVSTSLLERLSWLKAILQNITINTDAIDLSTDVLEGLVSDIIAVLPPTLGQKTSANSISVVLASDIPAEIQTVAVNNFPSTQTVEVSNFPGTQVVSGSLAVSNFPTSQAITATSLPLPTGAATESSLVAISADLTGRTSRESKNGVTDVVPGEWKIAIPAKSNRKFWRVHNPTTNTANLEVGYLIGSTNAATVILVPGGTIEESLPLMDVSPQAIVVRSTIASLSFYAAEAS